MIRDKEEVLMAVSVKVSVTSSWGGGAIPDADPRIATSFGGKNGAVGAELSSR